MAMSQFEIRANNIAVAIGASRDRIDDFGYEDDPVELALSAVNGSFVTWLIACEEARAQDRLNKPSASFTQDVIAKIPDADDPAWPVYIQPNPFSSLKERLEALWGVRVAYTHSDGRLNKIKNSYSQGCARDAPKHLEGLVISGDLLDASKLGLHVPIRTIVQLRDVLN